MESELANILMTAIPQTGFAGFLFYLFNSVKTELGAVRKEQKEEENQLRKEYKESEAALRTRYDTVISNLQMERDGFKKVLQDKIGDLGGKINTLERKIVELNTRVESILEKIQDLKERM